MSRKPLVLFLQFGFYVVAGCDNAPTVIEALPAIAESPSQDFTSHSTVGALQAQRDTRLLCSSDADCFHTGCLGQLCASQGIVTSCEFRCEYACYQQAACSCIGGRCGSRIAPELITCFRECGAPPNPFPLPPPPRSSDARAGGGLDMDLLWFRAEDGRTVANVPLTQGKTLQIERNLRSPSW